MSKGSPRVALCPECYSEVRFRQAPYEGQVKICPDCDMELVVVSVAPLELNASFDDFEDDDMDEQDDYEDETEFA